MGIPAGLMKILKQTANPSPNGDQMDVDPEDTLLWWRGAPYKKAQAEVDAETLMATTEAGVTQESSSIVEGTWRRLFEIDLRADMNESSSKQLEQEAKGMSEEI